MTARPVFAASTAPQSEPLICPACTRPIKPGQLFRAGEPQKHAFCEPRGLDVQRIAAAARAR